MVRVTPALGSRSLDRVMQCLPGQDIPPRGRSRGCVRGAERRECGGRTPAGGGQIGWPTVAPTPASMGRGRKEAAHTADSPPAPRPSCACQSCPRVSGSLAWPMPLASYIHATPALCHTIRLTRAVDLTLSPPKTVLWALQPPKYTTKQEVIPKIQIYALCIYSF